jgi:hypothetical protein
MNHNQGYRNHNSRFKAQTIKFLIIDQDIVQYEDLCLLLVPKTFKAQAY